MDDTSNGDNDDERRVDGISVGDPVARKTRLLAAHCATCVFRERGPHAPCPGQAPRPRRQRPPAGSFIVCHETLPYADPLPGTKPAICRGFYDRYDTPDLKVIRQWWGFVEVPPPDSTTSDSATTTNCPHRPGEELAPHHLAEWG